MVKKNIFIYLLRLFLQLFVSLFTSRILLQQFGAQAFGLFGVLVGLVMLFAFLQGALTTSFQRNFSAKTTELVSQELIDSLIIVGILALVFTSTAMVFGYWIIENQIQAADGVDLEVVKRAYKWLLLYLVVFLLQVPFSSLLAAEGKVFQYSLVTLIDPVFKFFGALALMLDFKVFENLIESYALYYAFSAMASVLVAFIIKGHIIVGGISSYSMSISRIKTLISFVGWNTLGNLASTLSNHGGNLLLNVYHTNIDNAARGLTTQLMGVFSSATTAIQLATGPKVVSLYVNGEIKRQNNFVTNMSVAICIICVPVVSLLYEYTENLLTLWLGNYPSRTESFLKLAVIGVMVDAISSPLMWSAQATAKVRNYQLAVGGVLLTGFPIAWLLMSKGAMPEALYIVAIFTSITAAVVRLKILKNMLGFDVLVYLKKVMSSALIMLALSLSMLKSSEYLLGEINWYFGIVVNSLILGVVSLIMIFISRGIK